MSPDHQQHRVLPVAVVAAVREIFKNDVEIFYVDDTDLIRVIFSIGRTHLTLDLELGREPGSTKDEYLIKSLSLDGSHNLFDEDQLKNFLSYGRDLKRLKMLEIRLSGIFSTVSTIYNPELQVVDGLQIPNIVEEIIQEENANSMVVAATNDNDYDGELGGSASLLAQVQLPDEPDRQVGFAALPVPDNSHVASRYGPYRSPPLGVQPNLNPKQSPQYVWNKTSTLTAVLSAALGAMVTWSGWSYFYPASEPVQSTPIAVPVTSRTPVLPPRPIIPRVTPLSPAPPRCPTYTIVSTARDRGVLSLLRRMERENHTVFTTYHLSPAELLAFSIRPRHQAEALARNNNDPRHVLGEQAHYRFGKVVTGDQITLETCSYQSIIFSHIRAGIMLYSFGIK